VIGKETEKESKKEAKTIDKTGKICEGKVICCFKKKRRKKNECKFIPK